MILFAAMDSPKITAQPVTCQMFKPCTAVNVTPKTMKIAAIALTSFALGYVAYRYYIGDCLCGPDTETLKRAPPKQPSSSRIQPPADGPPLTGSADVSFEIIPSSNVSTAQGTDGEKTNDSLGNGSFISDMDGFKFQNLTHTKFYKVCPSVLFSEECSNNSYDSQDSSPYTEITREKRASAFADAQARLVEFLHLQSNQKLDQLDNDK